MRPTSDHDRERLKAATERSITRAGGPVALAALTRVEAPALSKYKAPQEAGHFMPVDVAVDSDMAGGAPVILAAMATTLGYQVTPLPQSAPAPLSTTMVGTLIRETGDVSATVLQALADGRLTPGERKTIAKEIDEALQAMWVLKQALGGEG